MRRIFTEDTLENEFREKGYVKLRIMQADQAAAYYKQAGALNSGVDAPFHTSIWSSDTEYRKQADTLVKEALLKKASEYLWNYRPLFGEILTKKPSLTRDFPVHQDWTFVNEDIFTSVFLWCPLQDVTTRNGCLQVVAGSHRCFDRIRGANVPVSYDPIRHQIPGKRLVSLPLQAGECVIFSQALMHASPPNHTLKKRIAIGLLMVPEEAELFHYYFDKAGQELYKFKVDLDFFMHYSDKIDFKNALETGNFRMPQQYEILERRKYALPGMTLQDFENKLTQTTV